MDVILGTITTHSEDMMTSNSANSIQQDPWHAKISVNGKTINFCADTGADVMVVPERFFRENSPLIKKKTKKLFGPGQGKIKFVGQFQAKLSTKLLELNNRVNASV